MLKHCDVMLIFNKLKTTLHKF